MSTAYQHQYTQADEPTLSVSAKMLWITLAYLVLEFSFNARLLDVVGGAATENEMHGVEFYGQLISGFAMALVFWPLALRSRFRKTGLVLATALGMVLSTTIQTMTLDHLVDTSTATERYLAKNLMVVQRAIVTEQIGLANMDLSKQVMASPEGKTFLAAFPLLALKSDNPLARIDAQKARIVRQAVIDRLGTPDTHYANYTKAMAQPRALYAQYYDGSLKVKAAVDATPQRQREAWEQYRVELAKRKLTPDTVPAAFKPTVSSRVRYDYKLPLPQGWDPADKATFDQAVAYKIYNEAMVPFRKALKQLAPELENTPPGLGSAKFLAIPHVESPLRKALGYPSEIQIGDYADAKSFEQHIYQPWVRQLVAEQMLKLSAAPARFADGADLEKEGRSAMRMLLVPPLALAFSILGALVHCWKTGYRVVGLITGRPWKAKMIVGAALAAIVGVVVWMGNALVEQPLYRYLDSSSSERFGGDLATAAIKATIKLEHYAYPVCHWLHQSILGGVAFAG